MSIVISVLLAAPPLVGDTYNNPLAGAHSMASMELIERIGIGLAIVIGLIIALRFVLGGKRSFFRSRNSRIMESIPLGKGRFLAVVEVFNRVLILGVTDHNVSLLAEIGDKEDVDKIRLESGHQTQTGIFKNVLTSMGVTANPMPDTPIENPVERLSRDDEMQFIHNQIERMKRLSPHSDSSNN